MAIMGIEKVIDESLESNSIKRTNLAIKEKGFDGDCSEYFVEINTNKWESLTSEELEELAIEIGIGGNLIISKPSQSLLQKWLREKHNIHVEISLSVDGDTFDVQLYRIVGFDLDEVNYIKTVKRQIKTYEEVLEMGLQHALKEIKN